MKFFKTSNIFYNSSYVILILLGFGLINLVFYFISKKKSGLLIDNFTNIFIVIFYFCFLEFNFFAYLNKIEIKDTIELILMISFFLFSLSYIIYLNLIMKKKLIVEKKDDVKKETPNQDKIVSNSKINEINNK